jgi:hypothetical protein
MTLKRNSLSLKRNSLSSTVFRPFLALDGAKGKMTISPSVAFLLLAHFRHM